MRKLTCYAWGKPGDWEALCVDLDIATQGASFEEVRDRLQLMVEDFLDYAAELPEPNRKISAEPPGALERENRPLLKAQVVGIHQDLPATPVRQSLAPE